MIPAAVPKGATLVQHLQGTLISIYTDECMRVSTCRHCAGSILKGETRVAISEFHTPRMQSGGGKAVVHRFFWHPDCWKALADGLPDKTDHCWSCGTTVEFNARTNATHVGRGQRAPLCSKCLKSPDWNWCVSCNYWAHRHASSEVITEGVRSGQFVCDECVRHSFDDWLTVKMMKELKK